MATGTLLRMRPGRHSRIPGLGMMTPGMVFECPVQLNYGDGSPRMATAEDLIDSGLAERVEVKEKIHRPEIQRRVPREKS